MGLVNFYADFAFGLEKLNVYLSADDIYSLKFSASLPNYVTVVSNVARRRINLPGLKLSPLSCSVMEKAPLNTASFSILAKFNEPLLEISPTDLTDNLVKGEFLLCKFCQAKLINIKSVSKVDLLPPVELLGGSEPNAFFCHAKDGLEAQPISPLASAAHALSICTCLCNGVELIFNREAWNSDSILTVKSSDGIFCARCNLMIGHLVGSGSDTTRLVWANCLNVWREEFDIDGEYLRHIEVPLISSDLAFFGLLASQLLDLKCYRILLSVGGSEGPVEYAILWLFDQRILLYNGIVDLQLATGDLNEENLSDVLINQDITPERTLVSRVLYIVNTSDGDEFFQKKVLEWSNDFSVMPLTLPWETCVSLVSCLAQVTQKLHPSNRFATGAMAGFSVGGIPLRVN